MDNHDFPRRPVGSAQQTGDYVLQGGVGSPQTQPPKPRKKKKIFRVAFPVYLGILIVFCCCFLGYLHILLRTYENKQPGQVAKAEMERLITLSKNDSDSFSGAVTLASGSIQEWQSALRDAQQPVCKKKGDVHISNTLVYAISDGENELLDIYLVGSKTTTKLAIFSFTDWTVAKVTTPPVTYQITLDPTLTLMVNGVAATPKETISDTQCRYEIKSDAGEIVIKDKAGNETPYQFNKEIVTWPLQISVPGGYKVKLGNETLDERIARSGESEAQKYLSQWCSDIPGMSVYHLTLLSEAQNVTVTDTNGTETDYVPKDNAVSVVTRKGSEDLPTGVLTKNQILKIAETWSFYMTDDIGGPNHGYDTVAAYLKADSYLPQVARRWASSIDITFINDHKLSDPPFTTETVSDYIKYSDSAFSCVVYLEKPMDMNDVKVTDTTHATLYFVKEGNEWKLCGICDVVE